MIRREIDYQEAEKSYNEAWNTVSEVNEAGDLEKAIGTLKSMVTHAIRKVLRDRGIDYGLHDSYHYELYPIEEDVGKIEEGLCPITRLSDYKETLRRETKIKKTTNEIETRERILRRNIPSVKAKILALLQRIANENPLPSAL